MIDAIGANRLSDGRQSYPEATTGRVGGYEGEIEYCSEGMLHPVAACNRWWQTANARETNWRRVCGESMPIELCGEVAKQSVRNFSFLFDFFPPRFLPWGNGDGDRAG